LENVLFEELLLKVSIDKQKRIRKFYQWQDAQRTLFADLLVRAILIKYKPFKNSDIIFFKSKYGKPKCNVPGINFNVSHSEDWIVCAFDREPIGIDIEKIVFTDTSIANNFFLVDQYNDIINNKNPIDRF
jgi:4'-phosphopantetheinyl transferase